MGYKAVVFDLDGTLLDTLEDLMVAANHSLGAFGFAPRSLEHVRRSVGNGIHKLVERCVPEGASADDVERVFAEFGRFYAEHCADSTRAYDGILEMLEVFHASGMPLAVISNKADFAVQELMPQYFPDVFEIAVGEREGIKRKPAPDSLLHALSQMGVAVGDAVYVGDSEVDIATARNAGCACISCTWGFRTRDELVDAGATEFVNAPGDLVRMVTEG